ncbi:hypothetical protein Nepgr_019468 [Nepenthes gracilis]|uniref:non-specific serine/threonine protein kinase n=1 Tax=Nepenthes gracilis TaxID=150966 RepID=A0AAD3SVZ8_NEPGR|nr:hypothetical protein Nepgr_019468 [Nepenthes gracilis]
MLRPWRFCMLCALLACLAPPITVHSQDQSGFISIDCGLSNDTIYIDKTTGLQYTSDASFIDTGSNADVSPLYQTTSNLQQLINVRSFPQGTRNCYTLRPTQGKGENYLIRATFMYGNYDSLNKPPEFDIHLGVDIWDTVKINDSSQVITKEIIHTPTTADYLYVCLANTGGGTPFISTLELRPLNNSIYKRETGSLALVDRYYTYTTSIQDLRYKDDIYDRIWIPGYLNNMTTISTLSIVDSGLNTFKLPSSVMRAAMTPKAGGNFLELYWTPADPTNEFYIFMHFAELEKLQGNQSREFNITINDRLLYGPYVPVYLIADTVYSIKPLSGSRLTFNIKKTERSTLPPILNAVEFYMVKQLSQLVTNQGDVDAMLEIKSTYSLMKNWQGDPCSPRAYLWDGVNCTYDNFNAPILTSLNLSSSGLKGNISASFSNLTSLQVLDLSNNNLTGQIPQSLAELILLNTLNLAGNKLSGSIPQPLLERSKTGSLTLSFNDNPDLCQNVSCTNKKKKAVITPIIASIAAFLVLLAAVATVLFGLKKRRLKHLLAAEGSLSNGADVQNPAYSVKKGGLARFTHSEIMDMTKGFERELGRGGFGTVYYGELKDGTRVAVKMLVSSIQGSEQFQTEVELLITVRHKNLVSLIGYCDEENKLALVYEYMANGNLQTLMSGEGALVWKQRLQIAIDAAQGLDYLHCGCRPPIVHRDVKTPNILLNENLQAKVGDFGLSKIFPDEDKSYISTRVIGTDGYLDPEYHVTEQLNEKSDVYSFGVVLLELITGQAAVIISSTNRTNLVHWVRPMLDRGDLWSIVDKRLQEVHSPNSIWRAVDVAITCVKLTAVERPTMSNVVKELKECLAMEMDAGIDENIRDGNNNSDETRPVIPYTAMSPSVR